MTGSFVAVLLSLFTYIHPFYVSMADINFNEKDKTLEVSIRIFTDDLENTIRKYHKEDIDILHPTDQQKMNSYVDAYIQKNFTIKTDGKPAAMNFIGYERQSESIWTYFEIKNIASIKKLDISDALLYDYNSNQINMMHIKIGNKEQNDKIAYPEKAASFEF